jgi:plasmid stabilization system protein ParE
MKKIIYTPDAADKLREINNAIHCQYGSKVAKAIVGNITKAIHGIADNENMGPSVEKMFGVQSSYRYIFVARNYIFYSVESKCIKIINIYNEKEDFMQSLFGIKTILQETLDYWKE